MEENSTLANDSLKQDLQEIDDRIAELDNMIEEGKMWEQLHENEQFQKCILKGYFEDEPERILGVLVNPSTLKRDIMENLQDKLTAQRIFKQYIGVRLQNANTASLQLEDEKKFRDEMTKRSSEKQINLASDTEE